MVAHRWTLLTELISICCLGWNQILRTTRGFQLLDDKTGTLCHRVGLSMCVERARGCGWRRQERRKRGKEEGRTGKGASWAVKTGLGMVSVLRRAEPWRCEASCGQCCTKSGVRKTDTAWWGRGTDGRRTQKQNHASLFVLFCLFIKRKTVTGIVWYLKRNIQDLILRRGCSALHGVR